MSTPQKRLRSPLDLPEKAYLDVAIGADPIHVIAARYNLDEFDLEEVLKRPAAAKKVEAMQAELTLKGEFFKFKARALAEDLLQRVYIDAKTTDDPKTRLDAVKFLSGAGGVDRPVEQRQVGTGRQVSININLGAAGGSVQVNLDFDSIFGDGEAGSAAARNTDLIAEGEFEEVDTD